MSSSGRKLLTLNRGVTPHVVKPLSLKTDRLAEEEKNLGASAQGGASIETPNKQSQPVIPAARAASFLKYQEHSLVRPEMDLRVSFRFATSEGKIVTVHGKLAPSRGYLADRSNFLSQFATHLSRPDRPWLSNMREKCEIRPDMQLDEMLNRMTQYAVSAYSTKLSEASIPDIQRQLDKEAAAFDSLLSEKLSSKPLVATKTDIDSDEEMEMAMTAIAEMEEEEINRAVRLSAAEERRRKAPKLEPLTTTTQENAPIASSSTEPTVKPKMRRNPNLLTPADVSKPIEPKPPRIAAQLAGAPGRYDDERYNVVRAAFLTHHVYDLKSDEPSARDYIPRYLGTMPKMKDGKWLRPTYDGLLLYTKTENLFLQTVFDADKTEDLLELKTDAGVVARFVLADVTTLAPEHTASLSRDGTRDSRLEKLLAQYPVPCITGDALRWLMDNGCTDSIVNKLSVRMCVGFDPFYTRATSDGVQEAAILMDDKWDLKSKQRMAKRVLSMSAPSCAVKIFRAVFAASWKLVQDEFQRPGYVTGSMHSYVDAQPTPAQATQKMVEISNVAEQLEKAARVTHISDNAQLSVAQDKIAKLEQALRSQALATVDLVDMARRVSSGLTDYLATHECINNTKAERDVLVSLNMPKEEIMATFTKRSEVKKRVTSKYQLEGKLEAEEAARDEMTRVCTELNDTQIELQAAKEGMSQLQSQMQATLDEVQRLKDECDGLKHSAIVASVNAHKIAHSTRVLQQDEPAWITPNLEVDQLPAPSEALNDADWGDIVEDEL
ncbi:muNS [Reptilian orthoreovirus]|uniref:MuNS n=1 Tax=chelonian orthoreovirus TaxID=3071237 RepID=A0A1D7PVG7_9REOV|nr:muNS [Reptilian orthoreovirus]AOM63687.1 muNS [chelonian orthoreovirus]